MSCVCVRLCEKTTAAVGSAAVRRMNADVTSVTAGSQFRTYASADAAGKAIVGRAGVSVPDAEPRSRMSSARIATSAALM